jgi:hypothetical protein
MDADEREIALRPGMSRVRGPCLWLQHPMVNPKKRPAGKTSRPLDCTDDY